MKNLLRILMMVITLNANSQTNLITSIDDAGSGSPPPTAYQINEITLDFDGLKQIPESLRIDFPNDTFTIVPIGNFIPRNGFTIRADNDPPGTPPIYPTPGVPNDELDYLWTGSNSDYDVMLSVSDGQLIGLIASSEKRFGIKKTPKDTYQMIDINLSGYRPNDLAIDDMDLVERTSIQSNIYPSQSTSTTNIPIDDIKVFDMYNELYHGTNSSFTNLDILVFFTEQARIDAGGDPNDINDKVDIEALIRTSVDHANTALANSDTNTRITRLYSLPLDFPLTTDEYADRDRFANDTHVNLVRDFVGADITTLMIENWSETGFYFCGAAYVQTHPQCDTNGVTTGCGVGDDFENFAFSIVSQKCAVLDDTFTHELGHLFGGNHPSAELSLGWRLDVTNNGFPEAFGHKDEPDFVSIMSTRYTAPPYRRLYFSNPNVLIDTDGDGIGDTPTGQASTKNNAKIINDLSPAMSEYRERRHIEHIIFVNGFES